jgi:hypothetical protein
MTETEKFEHKVIYFFIPLPENLPLPDGFQVPIEPDYSTGRSYFDYINMDNIPYPIEFSLVFRQFEQSAKLPGFDKAFEIAEKYTKRVDEKTNTSPLEFEGEVTVVEAMCLVDEFKNEHTSQVFTKVLNHINNFINAYFEAIHTPRRLVSEANLPPMIPFVNRTITEQSTTDTSDGEIGMYLVNPIPSSVPYLKQDQPSSSQLTTLPYTFERVTMGLLDVYNGTRREAELAIRDGNNVTSVILCESSAEVLLRELLLFLHWEEGVEPVNAGWVILEHDFNQILASLQEKLGGNWSRSKAGAVKYWTVNLALLRDKVVHAGYYPDNEERDGAIAAFHGLVKYIADRVVNRWKLYPLANDHLIGIESARKRLDDIKFNMLTSLLNELHTPKSVPKNYGNWKYEVIRATSGKKARSSSHEKCKLFHLAYPSGEGLWWLVDREKKLVRRAKEPDMDDLGTLIKEPIEAAKTKGMPISTIVDNNDIKPRPLTGGNDWYEAYKVLPMFEIDRWPKTWSVYAYHKNLK